jgi:hypothetical protein
MYPFLTLYSFHDRCYLPLSTFYAFKCLCSHLFGYIFRNVVETSPNLAVDAVDVVGKMAPELATDDAGDAGKTAPESATDDAGDAGKTVSVGDVDDAADAAITAPELDTDDAGDAEETHPQLVADGPLQLIRDICNRISYPHVTKTASQANSGVAQRHTTQAHVRREATQGSGGARKKATQGGVSRNGDQPSPRRSARKTAGRKHSHSSSSSSSSADSNVVSE